MFPQGSFRNPYSTYGIGDRGQPARQPSRVSVPISRQQQQQQQQQAPKPPQPTQPGRQPSGVPISQQQQQQQVPKPPEPKKEELPKPTQPARLPSSSKPEEIMKQQDQQKVFTEAKVEETQPKPKDPLPSLQSVFSETNKDEKMSIVPAGEQGKAMVKGGSGEKSLQQDIKEDMTNLTRKLAELHAQQKLGGQGDQKLVHDLGARFITLAGENRGATMELGAEGRNHDNPFGVGLGRKVGEDDKSEEGKEKGKSRTKGAPVNAYVNSNVQAANNSLLYNSTCPHRDPGVRLVLSNSHGKDKEVGDRRKAKAAKNPEIDDIDE